MEMTTRESLHAFHLLYPFYWTCGRRIIGSRIDEKGSRIRRVLDCLFVIKHDQRRLVVCARATHFDWPSPNAPRITTQRRQLTRRTAKQVNGDGIYSISSSWPTRCLLHYNGDSGQNTIALCKTRWQSARKYLKRSAKIAMMPLQQQPTRCTFRPGSARPLRPIFHRPSFRP